MYLLYEHGIEDSAALHTNSFGKGSRPKPHELLKSQER